MSWLKSIASRFAQALVGFGREYLLPFVIGFVLGEVPQAAHQVSTGEPPACCVVEQVDGGTTS